MELVMLVAILSTLVVSCRFQLPNRHLWGGSILVEQKV